MMGVEPTGFLCGWRERACESVRAAAETPAVGRRNQKSSHCHALNTSGLHPMHGDLAPLSRLPTNSINHALIVIGNTFPSVLLQVVWSRGASLCRPQRFSGIYSDVLHLHTVGLSAYTERTSALCPDFFFFEK